MYPRELENRNPRNLEHQQHAFKIITQISDSHVTTKIKEEIEGKTGQTLNENIKVTDDIPANSLVVAAFHFQDKGLMFSDNVLSVCIDCGHEVQYRPYLDVSRSVILCGFCACDRVLKDYWNDQDNKGE